MQYIKKVKFFKILNILHHHFYTLLILFKSFHLLISSGSYIIFLSSFKIDEYNILEIKFKF
jgi:hypothetical protein